MAREFKWTSADEFFACTVGTIVSQEDKDSRREIHSQPSLPVAPILKGMSGFEYVVAYNEFLDQSEAYHDYMMDYFGLDPSEYSAERSMTRKIGDDIYEVTITHFCCTESNGMEESWKKNGEFHRYGGYPARTKLFNPGIPSEAYLAEHIEEFHINGKYIDMNDKTYESIMTGKSLAERQSVGYDI